MNKRLIWVEGDDFTGWCCSHCTWGITAAPHLESTVAALAFNRLAQDRRDGWRCQACGRRSNLEVHHQEFRSHCGDDSELNLITLCASCHEQLHRNRQRSSSSSG